MKIYIIKAFGGQWEDSWESDSIAVKSEERAKELVKKYNKEADKHHEEMMWYKDNPDEVPEHLNDMDEDDVVSSCSEHCKACEIEDYFPSDDHVMYRYEEVDLED